ICFHFVIGTIVDCIGIIGYVSKMPFARFNCAWFYERVLAVLGAEYFAYRYLNLYRELLSSERMTLCQKEIIGNVYCVSDLFVFQIQCFCKHFCAVIIPSLSSFFSNDMIKAVRACLKPNAYIAQGNGAVVAESEPFVAFIPVLLPAVV